MKEKKLCWVKWSQICSSKEVGGLGIKDVEVFNKALLEKWLRRFLVEKNSLWVRTLKARAKVDEELLHNPTTSKWWKDINCDDYGWFWSNSRRLVGDGEDMELILEGWVNNESPCYKFSRLFNLSVQKNCRVLQVICICLMHIDFEMLKF